jgi:hypothetical protein
VRGHRGDRRPARVRRRRGARVARRRRLARARGTVARRRLHDDDGAREMEEGLCGRCVLSLEVAAEGWDEKAWAWETLRRPEPQKLLS